MTEPPDPRPRPVLLPGGFHVWEVPRSTADPDKLRERELVRFARMTHPEARRDYAASQAGLREVLALYLDCPPERVTLGRRGREVYFREFCPAPGFLAAVASWQPLEWQGCFSL